jgi:hypothetical protein
MIFNVLIINPRKYSKKFHSGEIYFRDNRGAQQSKIAPLRSV